MAIFSINTIPKNLMFSDDVSLRKTCRDIEISELNEIWFKNLLVDMFETLYSDSSGVGLAAPQIGIHIKLAVIDIKRDGKNPIVLINPRYECINEEKVKSSETCLSIPSFSGEVIRYRTVKVFSLDIYGKEFEVIGDGFLSFVFQHEIDHLDGKLYIDRMENRSKLSEYPGYNNRLAMKSIKNLGMEV